MHLGLIGGIGPAATEFYYRRLAGAYAAAGQTMELTIVHADTLTLLKNLDSGAADVQARIFLRFVERLRAAGADVAVVTSLAGHFCINELRAISPLPLFDAIPVLDGYFAKQDVERIGLVGTRAVMESRLYGGVTSVEIVLPEGADLDETHSNYVSMAKAGHASEQQRDFFLSMGEKLCREQDADAVALAGTDLFLVFDGAECRYRVFDCAQIHIDALVAASTPGN